jgi:endonuclease/exonuclease/phosphatase family metal-dependent hydrolase
MKIGVPERDPKTPSANREAGTANASARRKLQAETITRIVEARTRPGTRYIVLGDMSDPPDSEALAPMTTASGLGLVNAITTPVEDEPAKDEKPGEEPQSPRGVGKQTGAFVDRRQRHGGDGSDHDPVWIELNL